MSSNYLETLRFTLTLENLLDHKINPTLNIGLNDQETYQFILKEGIQKFTFDEPVYNQGQNFLSLKVKEVEQAYNLNSFIIKDLKIHGISVTRSIFQCIYFPTYDKDYLKDNPLAPKEIKSGTYIGNRGVWRWYFDAPVYDNAKMRIGLF